TGTAGFIRKNEIGRLVLILLGNIAGCLFISLLARCSPMSLQSMAQSVLEGRLATGALSCGVLAIGCGFIMTTAVTFGRRGSFLPLLFGVPLFIVCGFPHCVADAFYYCCVPLDFMVENWKSVLPLYVLIVAGNFVGCNMSRWILPEKKDE
ncbi:MAG: formate/nitrite transporter family protein, partial [Bacteroidaceae bacterium]